MPAELTEEERSVRRQFVEIEIQLTLLMRSVLTLQRRQKELEKLPFERLFKLALLATDLGPAIQKNEREVHYLGTGAVVDRSGRHVTIPQRPPDFSFLDRLLAKPKKGSNIQ